MERNEGGDVQSAVMKGPGVEAGQYRGWERNARPLRLK
jgi:hypothetical protein